MASGKIWISTAFCVPSGSGIAVMPTKPPCLTSDSDALAMLTTGALSASFTVTLDPSRDVTASVEPSTLSIVPRTRVGGGAGDAGGVGACAAAIVAAKSKAKAALAPIILCIVMIVPPNRSLRVPASRAEGDKLKPRRCNVIPAALPGETRDRLQAAPVVLLLLPAFSRTTAQNRPPPGASTCQARRRCGARAPAPPG